MSNIKPKILSMKMTHSKQFNSSAVPKSIQQFTHTLVYLNIYGMNPCLKHICKQYSHLTMFCVC